ncbi:MAG: alanine--tRNA ligase, partial [Candidatus Aenigmarchaeota archaeon]|nr:alanine--tRNA ligase [Candidatus Aenigmarchaeota archaeon]
QVVDTGYGMERHVWASQGTPTIYESIYPQVINWIQKKAGVENYNKEIMENFCKVCGQLDVDEVNVDVARQQIVQEISKKLKYGTKEIMETIKPYHHIYQVADHARAIAFILGDGVVPSNTQEGYLARLLIRRSIRNMNDLQIGHIPFEEIVIKQIEDLQSVYPELKDAQDDIIKMLQVEQDKYRATLKKGESLVTRLVSDLKKKNKSIDKETLMMLYDSHGLLPRDVKKYAGDSVKIADVSDIDTKLAVQKEAVVPEEVRPFDITGILPTDLLYRGDEHLLNFNAKVLKILKDDNGQFVILDQTAFYPRGGGQEPDHGYLGKNKVYDVEKFGNVVVHYTKDPSFKEGDTIECSIDKKRRGRIVAHHTATHIIAGSTKKLLGPHIWQRGSKKDDDKAHIDLTHYKPLSDDEVRKIENMSNDIVNRKIEMIKRSMDRTSAEREYGFTIYQGGAVPGKMLRICSIEGHDSEACGGIHVDNTSEVGLITIIKTERPTDGTVRLIYKAGDVAKEFLEERTGLLEESAKLFGVAEKDVPKAVANLLNLWKEKRKLVEKSYEEMAKKKVDKLEFEKLDGIRMLVENIPGSDVNQLREISREMSNDDTVVLLFGGQEKLIVFGSAGKDAVKNGINVGKLVSESCEMLGGKGGGSPGLAQGFGTDAEKVSETVEEMKKRIRD